MTTKATDGSTRGGQRTRVVTDMSVWLDGFVAGANDTVEQPRGDGVRRFDRASLRRIALTRTTVVEGPGVTHLHFRADGQENRTEDDER
ncbi:hypothetical protein C2R22_22025 (plasmid) [Salinigranum rubrum]|uniref:Uncharacterized protein n=1 Tax=Salinigranum rubrum TaxID=755307 RepID=A0A2I8VQR3_9EURY|nr:hypothetical protein [Salinigranum rubrum]AUV84236.1 hypothetical protein C2R22_22025 [Salinigranum rubrum]